jgi:hypothetical protein
MSDLILLIIITPVLVASLALLGWVAWTRMNGAR